MSRETDIGGTPPNLDRYAEEVAQDVSDVAAATGKFENPLSGFTSAFADRIGIDSSVALEKVIEAQARKPDSFEDIATEALKIYAREELLPEPYRDAATYKEQAQERYGQWEVDEKSRLEFQREQYLDQIGEGIDLPNPLEDGRWP